MSVGVGWGLTDFSNGYKDIPPGSFQNKICFITIILIKFIMAIDGKYKIS